jgi:hypothetical protein
MQLPWFFPLGVQHTVLTVLARINGFLLIRREANRAFRLFPGEDFETPKILDQLEVFAQVTRYSPPLIRSVPGLLPAPGRPNDTLDLFDFQNVQDVFHFCLGY